MKYSSTTRLINTIIFAILAVAFGVLGVYVGIFVTPFIWNHMNDLFGNVHDNIGWGLAAMLGVFGLTGMLISLLGLVNSVRSLLKGNDDGLVRKSFSCYIAVGYTITLFALFNAVWLYRLTSSNIGYDDIGFVIVVFALLAIISLVVSNIPLIRLYGETEELNKIMRVITGPIVAATVSAFLVYGISFLVLNGAASAYEREAGLMEFGFGAIFMLVAALLSCLAFLGYGKADKKGIIRKGNGVLFEGSLFVIGAAIVFAGVWEYLNQTNKNKNFSSLVAKTTPSTNANYMDFSVMAWIFGGLLVVLALFLCYSTLRKSGEEKK